MVNNFSAFKKQICAELGNNCLFLALTPDKVASY